MDEQYSDALEELNAENDIHNIVETPMEGGSADDTKVEIPIDKKDDSSSNRDHYSPSPISPAAAALMAEKEAVNKELKLKLAEFDEEMRRRKNAQDTLIREAKANIDKEIDVLKEEARKAAGDLTIAIDGKLGAVLKSSSFAVDSEL